MDCACCGGIAHAGGRIAAKGERPSAARRGACARADAELHACRAFVNDVEGLVDRASGFKEIEVPGACVALDKGDIACWRKVGFRSREAVVR